MFNNDRESMKEMYETSLEKTCYLRLLITFELVDTALTINEIEPLNMQWKQKIQSMLGEQDAAFTINDGNIFVLLHTSNQKTFDKTLEEFIVYSKSGKRGVRSSALYLSNEESEFLIQLNF